jgi:peptidoglycan/LPS O-acetylase OafA/YrhL
MSTTIIKENRIEYLDSLRGLAAISVVFSHFVLAYELDTRSKLLNFSPFHIFYDGFAAVTFFFVLSGYVLTLSLKNKGDLVLGSFYLKRIFRIMPAYLFTLCISLVFYFFYKVIHTNPDSSLWINSFWGKPLDFANFVKQIIFILPSNGFAELNCQNWSLKVEMQFSFLIPFLYLIYRYTNFFFFFILNLVFYFFFNFPIYIFHFSLGITLAMNQDYILETFSNLKNKYNIILLCIGILMYTYRYTIPWYYYYFAREKSTILSDDNLIWFISGVGSFLLLLYSFTSPKIQKALQLSFFKFIGKISYTIYLTHLIVIIYVTPIFINMLNTVGFTNYYLILFLSLLFVLIITIGLSYFVTTFIEMPAHKLGGNFIRKYFKYWDRLTLNTNKSN